MSRNSVFNSSTLKKKAWKTFHSRKQILLSVSNDPYRIQLHDQSQSTLFKLFPVFFAATLPHRKMFYLPSSFSSVRLKRQNFQAGIYFRGCCCLIERKTKGPVWLRNPQLKILTGRRSVTRRSGDVVFQCSCN